MKFRRLRTAAATLGTTVGLVAVVCATAAPAQAADVSITLPGLVVGAADPFVVSGRCPAGTDSAFIVVEHGPMAVGGAAVDVAPNGSYRKAIDITEGGTGMASVQVSCYAYGEGMPLAQAYRSFYIVTAWQTSVEVPVSVSPSRVPVGGTIRVSATCQPGATSARFDAVRADGHEPFSSVSGVPSRDGTVTAELPVTANSGDVGDLFTARPGPAYVFVGCTAPGDSAPVGVGVGKFTITAGSAAAPVPAVGDRPASAAPQLANTGSDAAPMTALAAALVLTGAGAHALRRRLATA